MSLHLIGVEPTWLNVVEHASETGLSIAEEAVRKKSGAPTRAAGANPPPAPRPEPSWPAWKIATVAGGGVTLLGVLVFLLRKALLR